MGPVSVVFGVLPAAQHGKQHPILHVVLRREIISSKTQFDRRIWGEPLAEGVKG